MAARRLSFRVSVLLNFRAVLLVRLFLVVVLASFFSFLACLLKNFLCLHLLGLVLSFSFFLSFRSSFFRFLVLHRPL